MKGLTIDNTWRKADQGISSVNNIIKNNEERRSNQMKEVLEKLNYPCKIDEFQEFRSYIRKDLNKLKSNSIDLKINEEDKGKASVLLPQINLKNLKESVCSNYFVSQNLDNFEWVKQLTNNTKFYRFLDNYSKDSVKQNPKAHTSINAIENVGR